jgi:hypothetical protein
MDAVIILVTVAFAAPLVGLGIYLAVVAVNENNWLIAVMVVCGLYYIVKDELAARRG